MHTLNDVVPLQAKHLTNVVLLAIGKYFSHPSTYSIFQIFSLSLYLT